MQRVVDDLATPTSDQSTKGMSCLLLDPYTPFTLGHGSHVSRHRCRTSAKRDWRETTQGDGVLKRDCRGCRARILNCQKFYHGSHGADDERSKTGCTQQNVTVPNRP